MMLANRYTTLVLLSLALPFICLVGRPLTGDIWWVLANGQELVRQGGLLHADPFTFSPHTESYVDAQWLAQLSYYAAYSALGLEGVSLFNALVGTLTFGLLWHLAWKRSRSAPVAALTTVFAGLNVVWYMHPRAQTLALATFAATLNLLDSSRVRIRGVLGLAAIEAVWANLHGSFFLGPLLTLAMLVGEVGDGVIDGRRPGELVHSPRLRFLALALASQTAASLLTPYGLGLYQYALGLSTDPVIRGYISEWLPTSLSDLAQGEFFASLALVGLVLASSRRRVRLADLCVLGGFAVLGLQAYRNIAWWGVACAPIVAPYLMGVPLPGVLRRVARRLTPARAGIQANLRHAVLIGLVTLAALPWARAANPLLPAGQRSMTSEVYPVQAVDFLAAHDLGSRVFNQHPWGAYLDWRLWPRYQPLIDSAVEQHPDTVWFDIMKLNIGHASFQELLDRYAVDTLLLSLDEQRHLIEVIRESPRWHQVYQDDLAVIYVRRSS